MTRAAGSPTAPLDQFYCGKRICVTGGASFIGSTLVEALVAAGARVRVADDFSSGRIENLKTIERQIEIQRGDLRDPALAARAAQDCEIVFHLAACHGGRGYIDTHPVECSTNMILDGVVFGAAAAAGVERVCFASSACIYPTRMQEDSPDEVISLREEFADPLNPQGCASDGEYGWAKLMGEMTLRAYHKQFGLKGVSCRIFTAFGERENETHAVIALIAKAFIRQDPYQIWGNGKQSRNFTYVGDIVAGLMHAAAGITDASAVNVGTDRLVSIDDAAKMIFELTGFHPGKIEYQTDKPIGVFRRVANLDRARTVLQWEPQVGIEEGLRRTIEWYFRSKDRAQVAADLNRSLSER